MPARKRFDPKSALPGSPFLTHLSLRDDRVQAGVYPFTMKWLPRLSLQVSCPVTFLVGENGTGKSTLLEAIAWSVGFGAQQLRDVRTLIDESIEWPYLRGWAVKLGVAVKLEEVSK